MVIRNLEEQYIIIRKCREEGEQYLCREESGRKSGERRIIRIPLKQVRPSLIAYVSEQLKKDNFADFGDYFTDDQYLYVMMIIGQGIPLSMKLAEERCSLRERFKIGEGILTDLILQDVPDFFFEAAMDPELIRVSRSMDVFFDYDLSRLPCFEEGDFQKGARKLGGVFRLIFENELKLRALPELERLIYEMEHEGFSSYLDIHKAFIPIAEEWSAKEETDLKPGKWSFRLWEKIKMLGRMLKKLALAAILLLALAYLALSIREYVKAPEIQRQYEQIGDLKIQEIQQEESEE